MTPALIAELEGRYQVVRSEQRDRVRDRFQHQHPRRARALASCARRRAINVNYVSQTCASEHRFIIRRSDYKQAIIALNHSLCVTPGVPVPRA